MKLLVSLICRIEVNQKKKFIQMGKKRLKNILSEKHSSLYTAFGITTQIVPQKYSIEKKKKKNKRSNH